MILGQTRRIIGFLQIYPVITSLAFLFDIVMDFAGVNITAAGNIAFGISAFPLICMYLLSRKAYVQRWSIVLYVTLIAVLFVDICDLMFGLRLTAVEFDRVMFGIISSGCMASFVTFIYTKYKQNGNIQGNSEHGARQEQAVE